jgi:hypothetical protein
MHPFDSGAGGQQPDGESEHLATRDCAAKSGQSQAEREVVMWPSGQVVE